MNNPQTIPWYQVYDTRYVSCTTWYEIPGRRSRGKHDPTSLVLVSVLQCLGRDGLVMPVGLYVWLCGCVYWWCCCDLLLVCRVMTTYYVSLYIYKGASRRAALAARRFARTLHAMSSAVVVFAILACCRWRLVELIMLMMESNCCCWCSCRSSSGEVDAYVRGRGRRMIKIEKLVGIDAKWRLCSARQSWHWFIIILL